MKKFAVHCTTSTVGTDDWKFIIVEDEITEDQLNDICYTLALENADIYGIYPPDPTSEIELDEEYGESGPDESICGCSHPYNPDEHDPMPWGRALHWEDLTYVR